MEFEYRVNIVWKLWKLEYLVNIVGKTVRYIYADIMAAFGGESIKHFPSVGRGFSVLGYTRMGHLSPYF